MAMEMNYDKQTHINQCYYTDNNNGIYGNDRITCGFILQYTNQGY